MGYHEGVAAAYCPHCFLEVDAQVEHPWPARIERCPHCRLSIGPGRARETCEDAGSGARSTAAGVLAHEARSAEPSAASSSPDHVRDAIRAVAERTGSRPERLLMIDYQARASHDASLPPLEEVFATFGTWKRARRESAVR
jgi:NMD protein affecting ribosome stability and mRNA decay